MDFIQNMDLKMPALEDEIGDISMQLDLDLVVDEKIEMEMEKTGENDSNRVMSIEELRELIYEKGAMTPLRMDDDYLLRFLRARNFKVEPAFNLLKKYCQFRENNPQYFDMNLYDLIQIGEANILNVLPYRDQDGHRIIVFKIGNWNPNELSIEELFKSAVCIMEAGVLEPRSQVLGGVSIFDMEGLSMQHALYLTPAVVSKILQIISTSFPLKISAIHIVNESWVFEQVFKLFKPFLSPRYEETVHFHGNNMNSLHKFIEPKYLPKAYGGIRPDHNYVEWCIGLTKQDKVVEAMKETGFQVEINDAIKEKLLKFT